MKLIIGADLVPTKTNEDLFIKADVNALIGEELQALLSQADYRIFNLEEPLTDGGSPIEKCGPCLKAPRATINGIKSMCVNVFTLANNHIMDYGESGLNSTCESLKDNDILYFGVGKDVKEAAKPLILEKDGKSIGIIACVEHEFSAAGANKTGANPFDPLETPDEINRLKSECDFVIVLYHGGKEFYRYPSPNLQKTCRKLVEKGANLVITQHCHCIGCYENYLNATIVYGQGNFIFDDGDNEYWNSSLLVGVSDDFNLDFIPLTKAGSGVRLAEGAEKEEILNGFNKRSEEIKQDGFIEKSYAAFANSRIEHYLLWLNAKKRGFFFKVMNKLTKHKWQTFLLKKRYKKKELLAILNYIECEAHRELLLQGIKNRNAE